jgi:Arc/MetJ-type ribon-helix-helix transcriptional regulator
VTEKKAFNLRDIFDKIRTEFGETGIAIDFGDGRGCCGEEVQGGKVKFVCVAPGLRDCVEELGRSTRDQVVMVRVDSETSEALDAWVETGALKSRSEAAALFIQEGLKVRADELDRLRDALKDVETARSRLKEQAREVLGRVD